MVKEKNQPQSLLYAVSLGINNKNYLRIPGLDKFYGYDFIARDWVVPYGQGTHRDFLFKLDVHSHKSFMEFNATLTLKFSNPDDGFISVLDKPDDGSELRLSHHAPLNGYQPKMVKHFVRTMTEGSNPIRSDQNYFFRIRSKIDDEGNVESALYGKIHGDIKFGLGRKQKNGDIDSSISFIYYLNPDSNNTNLEYDSSKNLFKHLTDYEGLYGLTP